MSLSEDLAQLRADVGGENCRTCRWYKQQPEKVRAEFDACVEDPRVTKAALLEACVKHGLTACQTQFGVHIRKHHGKS